MCTKTIFVLFPSIFVAVVAVFMSLDSFQVYRQQLWDNVSTFMARPLSRYLDPKSKDVIYFKKDLIKYDGKHKEKGIRLAVLGKVFDVSEGARHYGPDGSYHFFAGRDASRAYVSGDFSEKGLIEDVSGLTPKDLLSLEEWVKFFQEKYKYLGKLNGHFYDEKGQPTQNLKDALEMIGKGHASQVEDEYEVKKFPHCNSAWTKEAGSQVWCTEKSGGYERSWAGVPRLYFRAGASTSRCACVRTTGPPSDGGPSVDRGDLDSPLVREYRNCDPKASWCHLG